MEEQAPVLGQLMVLPEEGQDPDLEVIFEVN